MRTITRSAFFALLLVASSSPLSAQDSVATKTEPATRCNFRSSPYAFFPSGALSPQRTDLDAFEQCWYGSQLTAMGEPVLHTLALPADAEVYRFTWLRTFQRPIAVRVERRGAKARLLGIELDGAGGYAPGKPARRVDRALSEAEWRDFRRAVEKAEFWTLSATSDRRGEDGAQWILEGRTPSRYRVVARWTPDADGPDAAFRAACIHLLSLAGLLPASYVY